MLGKEEKMDFNDWPTAGFDFDEVIKSGVKSGGKVQKGGRKVTTANATFNLPPYNFVPPRKKQQRKSATPEMTNTTVWHFPENDDYPETGITVLVKIRGKRELTAGYIRHGNWIVLGDASGIPDVERWRRLPKDDYRR